MRKCDKPAPWYHGYVGAHYCDDHGPEFWGKLFTPTWTYTPNDTALPPQRSGGRQEQIVVPCDVSFRHASRSDVWTATLDVEEPCGVQQARAAILAYHPGWFKLPGELRDVEIKRHNVKVEFSERSGASER
jgi:hypothetical protein